MPDMSGRCDMFPAGTVWERTRHSLGQCILAVAFVTGGMKTDDPYGVTVWLSQWAVFAYVSHVALFRLLGHPNGAVVTFALIVPFYVIYKLRASGIERATK